MHTRGGSAPQQPEWSSTRLARGRAAHPRARFSPGFLVPVAVMRRDHSYWAALHTAASSMDSSMDRASTSRPQTDVASSLFGIFGNINVGSRPVRGGPTPVPGVGLRQPVDAVSFGDGDYHVSTGTTRPCAQSVFAVNPDQGATRSKQRSRHEQARPFRGQAQQLSPPTNGSGPGGAELERGGYAATGASLWQAVGQDKHADEHANEQARKPLFPRGSGATKGTGWSGEGQPACREARTWSLPERKDPHSPILKREQYSTSGNLKRRFLRTTSQRRHWRVARSSARSTSRASSSELVHHTSRSTASVHHDGLLRLGLLQDLVLASHLNGSMVSVGIWITKRQRYRCRIVGGPYAGKVVAVRRQHLVLPSAVTAGQRNSRTRPKHADDQTNARTSGKTVVPSSASTEAQRNSRPRAGGQTNAIQNGKTVTAAQRNSRTRPKQADDQTNARTSGKTVVVSSALTDNQTNTNERTSDRTNKQANGRTSARTGRGAWSRRKAVPRHRRRPQLASKLWRTVTSAIWLPLLTAALLVSSVLLRQQYRVHRGSGGGVPAKVVGGGMEMEGGATAERRGSDSWGSPCPRPRCRPRTEPCTSHEG